MRERKKKKCGCWETDVLLLKPHSSGYWTYYGFVTEPEPFTTMIQLTNLTFIKDHLSVFNASKFNLEAIFLALESIS